MAPPNEEQIGTPDRAKEKPMVDENDLHDGNGREDEVEENADNMEEEEDEEEDEVVAAEARSIYLTCTNHETLLWVWLGTKPWKTMDTNKENPKIDDDFVHREFLLDLGDIMDGDPDVYNVCALLKGNTFLHRKEQVLSGEITPQEFFYPSKFGWCLNKCFICVMLQALVIPIIILDSLFNTLDGGSSNDANNCSAKSFDDYNTLVSKVTAFFLGYYLLLKFSAQMKTINSLENQVTQMVLQENRISDFLNYTYAMGYMVNFLAMCFSHVGSVVLIYISDTPINMILNVTAMFFIMELDDNMAAGDEKKAARKAFQKIRDKIEKDGVLPPTRPLPAFWHVCKFFMVYVSVFSYITMLLAPYFLFVCFGFET